MVEGMRDLDCRDAIYRCLLDRGVRHLGRGWFRSVLSQCSRDEESAGAQKRRPGEPVADEAAHIRALTKFVSSRAGNPHYADLLATAQRPGANCEPTYSTDTE